MWKSQVESHQQDLFKKPSVALLRKAFFVLPFLLLIQKIPGQSPPFSPTDGLAFKPGEELSYQVKYEWKGVWTKVGKAIFSVEKDTCSSSTPCYRFEGKGWTLPFYDLFFKVRDLYRSWAEKEDLSPIRFYRKVREGRDHYVENYLFQEHEVAYQSSARDEIETFSYPPGALDVLTAIYYCRSMDLGSMSVGDTVPIDLILENEIHSTHFVYRGIRSFEHPNGKRYRCHRIEPRLIEGSIFKEGDRMKVFVTADRRKLPVFVETEIIVGTVKVYLSDVKGAIDP